MKYLTVAVLFLLSLKTYAQKEAATLKVNDSKVTSLIFTVDSLEELKDINWNDIKDMVKDNKLSDSVALGFRVRSKKNTPKISYKHSIEVKGKSEDIDEFIEINKRYIKILEKL